MTSTHHRPAGFDVRDGNPGHRAQRLLLALHNSISRNPRSCPAHNLKLCTFSDSSPNNVLSGRADGAAGHGRRTASSEWRRGFRRELGSRDHAVDERGRTITRRRRPTVRYGARPELRCPDAELRTLTVNRSSSDFFADPCACVTRYVFFPFEPQKPQVRTATIRVCVTRPVERTRIDPREIRLGRHAGRDWGALKWSGL